MSRVSHDSSLIICTHVLSSLVFPAETLAGIEEFFKSVDADGSGTVNKSELKAFLTAAGCPAGDIDATAEQVCNPLSCVVIGHVSSRGGSKHLLFV